MFDGENWSITDMDSRNGTFVDGRRIKSSPLSPGDFIYIMGLKIVIGDSYFAVNNPDMQLQVKGEFLHKYIIKSFEPLEELPNLPEKSSSSEPRVFTGRFSWKKFVLILRLKCRRWTQFR